jgi:broad specificity phosphatase PhoE
MPYLYLVRHGQPDFAGNYDSITDLGGRQSGWLGQHFADNGLAFDRVVSGTLQRQVATLEHIQAALPAPAPSLQDPRLNEFDHLGLLQMFEGDHLAALRAAGDRRAYFTAISRALQRWSRHDGPLGPLESWTDFGTRIEAGMAAACAGLPRDARVLVVSSGGVIGCYTSSVLRANADAAIQLNLQIRNTSITEIIRPHAAPARLVSFNAIPHLERPDRLEAITHS